MINTFWLDMILQFHELASCPQQWTKLAGKFSLSNDTLHSKLIIKDPTKNQLTYAKELNLTK